MLIRLSGAKRSLVGRVVALAYLLCVLAPGSALAFGDGRLSEHCLSDMGLATATPQQHDADALPTSAGYHQHPGIMHQHDHGTIAGGSPPSEPSQHKHAMLDLQCCGMQCVAALPAAISDVVTPCASHAFALPENGDHLADNLPARHYRPPIA